MRPDSNGRAYVYCDTNLHTVIDACGDKNIRLVPEDDASHDNAFALYLAVTDYLNREGYFDPDGLESADERYNRVFALLNNLE